MASYEQPTEYLPSFSSSDFLAGSDTLSLSKANSLYARLAGSNIMSGILNTFNNPVLIDNINLSNAGSTQNNIFLTVDLATAITTGYNNISIGSQSLKLITTGYQNIALGVYAGYNLINGAYDNISIGANANSDPLATPNATVSAIAIGSNSNAYNDSAVAIGVYSGSNLRSVAIGYNSGALSTDSVALGSGTVASGTSSVAIGLGARGTNVNAVALGNSSNSSGNASTAIGYNSSSFSTNTTAIGTGSYVANGNSTAVGANTTTVTYTNSTALGYGTACNANNQIALGTTNETTQIAGLLNVIKTATFTLPSFLSAPIINYTTFSPVANQQGYHTTSTTLVSNSLAVTNTVYQVATITIVNIGLYLVDGYFNTTTLSANGTINIIINTTVAQSNPSKTTYFNGGALESANLKVTFLYNITTANTIIYLCGFVPTGSNVPVLLNSTQLRATRL